MKYACDLYKYGDVFVIAMDAQNEPFTMHFVDTDFNSVWEVVYGPNDSLWVTEKQELQNKACKLLLMEDVPGEDDHWVWTVCSGEEDHKELGEVFT